MISLPSPAFVLSLLLCAGLTACQTAAFEDDEADSEDSESSEDSAEGSTTESESTTTTGGGPTFNCDPSDEMPCPEGQKCTVLTNSGIPVYECVNDDGGKLPFDPCTTAPSSGQDECPAGTACIPEQPGGGSGLCLELCIQDNDCDAALCSNPPGQQVPVCAPICDPLAPLCPNPQTCQRARQSAFVCQFPGEGNVGTTAEPCDIASDSGCAAGFVCETGQIIPGCEGTSCCTALCDTAEADGCPPPTSCGELPLDPIPGLENVGACYVPQ